MIEAHNKVVEPPGEAKPDAWIFNEVGRRVAPQYWFENVEKHAGPPGPEGQWHMTWKEFSRMLVSGCWARTRSTTNTRPTTGRKGGGFPTPTGKMEFYSNAFWRSWATTRCRSLRAGREPLFHTGAV